MEDVSLLALAGRLIASMAIVLGLMALAARSLRRRGLAGGRPGAATGRIEVLARQGLGRTSSVQLVRVGGKTLVLGVTEASVRVLAEADPLLLEAERALAEAERPAGETRPASFPSVLQFAKDLTTRRS